MIGNAREFFRLHLDSNASVNHVFIMRLRFPVRTSRQDEHLPEYDSG